MKKASRIVYQLSKRFIPSRLASQLAVSFLGYSRVFDAYQPNAFQLRQSPRNRLVSKNFFLSNLFNAFYKQINADEIVPDTDVVYAQSFVPYYRGVTNLVIYNFFSRNYGIRDPILYRFTILDESKPVRVFNRILSADQVLLINNENSSLDGGKLLAHGSLVVQAFHPKIRTPADQLRFLAIYHDEKRGTVSGVHSMQMPSSGIASSWKPSFRSFGFSDISAFASTCVNSHVSMRPVSLKENAVLSQLEAQKQLIGQNAYYTMEDGVAPSAIWHDGPAAHSASPALHKKKTGPCQTAFFVPRFEFHAPILFFSEFQVGFRTEKMTVSAFDENQRLKATECVHLKMGVESIDLKTLFEKYNLSGPLSFVVNFDRDLGEFIEPPACYLHIYYRSNGGYADQTHSDHAYGYQNDPAKKAKSYRCRKFAPLIRNARVRYVYSVINVGGYQPNPDSSINVRIISDRGAERVIRFDVPRDGVAVINGEALLKAIDYHVDKAAIVQLEHETTNFNGMWFCEDLTTHCLGADHFTGG